MFSNQPTPFDLVFWMGLIKVRVIPWFWLMAILVGRHHEGIDLIFIWMLCVFVSVLLHELGHALVGEAFGYETEIVLHSFGGATDMDPLQKMPAHQSLLVDLAGPFAQLALSAVLVVSVVGLNISQTETPEYVDAALTDLLLINIVWPIFNLFPLLPLDGGRILKSLLALAGVVRATFWTLRVTLVLGVLGAIGMASLGQPFMAIMLGFFALQAYFQLQEGRW